MATALAVQLALALDAVVGEPPRRLHPVAWFGGVLAFVDRDWARPRAVGLAVAVVAPIVAATIAGVLVAAVALVSIPAGAGVGGLVLFVATSRRMLIERARTVVRLSDGDLDRARLALRSLAGRDPSDLSPGLVRSAAVESAAENCSDGLVAPLLGFVVGATVGSLAFGASVGPAAGLALGAAGAAWVKAVNTLDSMVGYPDRRVGWASARLDDVTMWLPARVTAVLLAVVAGRPGLLGEVGPGLSAVPSPNAGWPMGTIAAAADCRLEKSGSYDLNPDTSLPSVETALGAIRTVNRTALVAYAVATLVVAVGVIGWF